MTRQELEGTYIINEHGTFTPRYEISTIEQEIDGEVVIVEDYTIIATSEEVYQEFLDPPVNEPDKMEALECRVASLESVNAGLLLANAQQQIKLQEYEASKNKQELLNANMLLEIAMLKGVI